MNISDYAGCSDEELISLSRNGEDGALDFLIARYVGLVRQKAFRYFLVGADKEDLVQEGLIGLFKATRDYDASHSVPFKSFAGDLHHAPDSDRYQGCHSVETRSFE